MRIDSYSIVNDRYDYLENKICISQHHVIKHQLNFTLEGYSGEYPVDEVDIYLVDYNGNLYKLSSYFDGNSLEFYTDSKETEYARVFIKIKINHLSLEQFLDIPIVDIKSNTKTFVVYKQITVSKESNLFYSKASAYVPSWSKAYKEYGSNFSKIVEPYFKLLQGFYNTLDYNLSNEIEYKVFKYNEDVFKLYTEDGTQILEQNSLLTGSQKICELVENTSELQLESIYLDSTDILKNYVLPFTSKLYINKFQSSVDSVVIEGLDENDNYVTESINLVGNSISVTKYKYKVIKYLVTQVPILLANYVDCFSNHFVLAGNPTPMPLLIDKNNYSIFYPKIKIENIGNSTSIGIYNKQDCVYRYFFKTNNIKGIFVDKYLNVYWIEANKLLMSTLYIDLSQYSNNAYENSGSFIDYEYTYVDGWIDIVIDFDKLNENTTIVSMSEGGVTYYLNTETKQLQTEKYIIENSSSLGVYSFKVLPEEFPLKVSLITKNQTYPLCISPLILEPNKATQFNIDTSVEKLALVNDSLTLLKNQTNYNLSTTNSDLILIFNSKDCNGINFKLDISNHKIDNYELPLSSDYISRLYLEDTSSIVVYKINYKRIKHELFKSADVTFSVKAYKEESTFVKNTSECFLSIFIDGINKGDFPLSINTDEDYQYNFIINNSMDLQEI